MGRFKTLEEFMNEYYKNGTIDKLSFVFHPVKPLNEKQIKRYYESYCHKWHRMDERASVKKDLSCDAKLSIFVRERDETCRLLSILTAQEFIQWYKHEGGFGKVLDAAHVFGKSAYPWMRYEMRNVVLLNRFSHSCLDTGKSPITGHPISTLEKQNWWKRIVGKDWEYLEEMSLNKN